MSQEGKPYCFEDYQKLFAKRCGGCQKTIQGPHVKAMEKEYHSDCFICSNCRGTLSNGFFEKNSHPYCKDCL